jgi:hypothetical protein
MYGLSVVTHIAVTAAILGAEELWNYRYYFGGNVFCVMFGYLS